MSQTKGNELADGLKEEVNFIETLVNLEYLRYHSERNLERQELSGRFPVSGKPGRSFGDIC